MVKVGSPHQPPLFTGLVAKGTGEGSPTSHVDSIRKAGVRRVHFSAKKLCSLILGLLCQLYPA